MSTATANAQGYLDLESVGSIKAILVEDDGHSEGEIPGFEFPEEIRKSPAPRVPDAKNQNPVGLDQVRNLIWADQHFPEIFVRLLRDAAA